MRGSFILAIALSGLGVFGAIWPALANSCRVDLHECIAVSGGRPHICDPLVRNMPTCEENERKGIHQSTVNPKYTKAAIIALYNIK